MVGENHPLSSPLVFAGYHSLIKTYAISKTFLHNLLHYRHVLVIIIS
jgi:hypothetical protein